MRTVKAAQKLKGGVLKVVALKEACKVVERYARSIGPNCQIVFTENGVEVAPLSWSGSVMEQDLYTALTTAFKERGE